MTAHSFPKNFLWGTAASAYQIEGAVSENGRSASVWDTFCRVPGKILHGDNGDIACDHYHRYKEDIRLMADLGIQAYRLSVAWPRVLPNGTGKPNPQGLDFYDRVVDELLKHGIVPFVNFYHWDHPQVLEDKGGWRNRDFTSIFADYASVVVRRLSDRVTNWMTLNEPPCIAFLSYQQGIHAPGAQEPPRVVNQIIHHVLLAHGLCVQAVRQQAVKTPQIGLAHNPGVKIPKTESPEDLAAAKQAWSYENGVWFDPMFKGRYPLDYLKEKGPDAPTVRDGDMKIISSPLDYMGINIYTGTWVQAAPGTDGRSFQELPSLKNHPKTTMGWDIIPETIYYGLKFFADQYSVPKIYLTENGCSFNDTVGVDGKVHDPQRIDYLQKHLAMAHRALSEGVKLEGYFVWSFLDNFEWSFGYTKRFGLLYTDFPTQQRIPKDSALWYRSVIEKNGI